MVEGPRSGPSLNDNLIQGIEIPDHPAIELNIGGVQDFPSPCHIKVLAVRKFNGNSLDFHCVVNREDFAGNSRFLPNGLSPIMRFLVKVNQGGTCQIDQIVNMANRYVI